MQDKQGAALGPRMKSGFSSIQIHPRGLTKCQGTPSPWTCPKTPTTQPQRDPENMRSWKVTFPKLFCWRTHLYFYSWAGNFRYDVGVGVLPYQSLLDKEAEENGIAHFSEALEHISLQLCILNYVLQLMVEKLQDSLKEKEAQSERDWNHFL